MTFGTIAPEHARLGLRAMKQVALANGRFDREERALLSACAGALGLDDDPASLEPVSHDELRDGLTEPLHRERVVQAMIVAALIDGEASDDEVRVIEAAATALGVSEPRVRNLRQLCEGRVRWLWLDLARKSFARPVFVEALRDEGLAGVYKMVGPMLGLATDHALAQRYIALGGLDAGSFGRAYYDFLVANGLPFPGEPNAVPERGVWHDLSHVLSGYGVDPAGEVSVVSFIAGYRREDPFFWLFTIALQFQLGLKVSPYSPAGRGYFEPERVLRALARGAALRVDLSDHWDFWPLLPLPLEQVRRELNVPPLEGAESLRSPSRGG